ncbi:hypothetical protein NFI96_018519, partial [Prochilodus magdalenae]
MKGDRSQRLQKQVFVITGHTEQPAINVSYGPMSVEQSIPPELVNAGPRVRAFILARQVRSSAPVIRLLFYATSKIDLLKDVSDQVRPGQSEAGYICVTAHAFWALLEIRGTCSIPANGGFCLAHLKPEPAWFNPGIARSSREQRGDSRGTVVELYYQTRPSPTSQCVAQDSNQWKGANEAFGPNMKKIGNVNLLRSPPGNPTFMRLRLGGTVIVQTSSKPLRNADTATFYIFLSSTSPVEHFILSKNDESAYREEVQRLTDWCRTNNLSLNVDKTKEMVVYFRRTRRDHSPLYIDGSTVEIVKSTKFLGVHLAEDLTWSLNTSTITKKAQQRLYFLRRLRKAHLPPPILTTFYRGTIESILSSCITAWFGNCTASDRKSLQRVVRTAGKIIGVSLPTVMDIYTTRCIRKATSIVDDHTHLSHTLFTLLPAGKRATVRRGMSFSTARPSDPQLWDIALDPGKGSNPQTISVICQRKNAFTGKRQALSLTPSITVLRIVLLRGLLEVLQLDFDTQEQNDQLESQMITFRLELPGNMIRDEGTMKIYTVQRDYVGIVPLIPNTELLNTAVLTGKKVSIPVRVLGVEADGSVSDITNSSRCRSADEDTLKVSERCESVYMNGEETRGRVRMAVNFTYSHLSAQLEVSVWMPHLPLQIDMSDPELSQIKGWRVPVSEAKRATWDSEEDDEKKGRGCMLQYQHSLVRVLTAFTAEAPDSSGSSPVYFLGPEWLVDVTGLVRYSLKVGDTSIMRLQSGTVLSGRAAGVTTVQVVSPLSDTVLAERMVRVLDDKVSITELGLQLVSGLSLSLQLVPGSNRAIAATATTQDTMHTPKQEAVVACWVKFSDGSQAPLDLFDPSGYALTVSSLDKRVVSVGKVPGRVVVAEAEGHGLLLRAELAICEACQKSKRKSKLAVGAGTVRVKFLSSEQPAGESGRTKPGIQSVADYGSDSEESKLKLSLTSSHGLVDIFRNSNSMQESTTREIITSTKSSLQEAIGGAISTIRASDFTSQEEEPKEDPSLVESDLMRTFGFFTDLEICIYSLVGVSCLAIIAILLNCATHNTKSRSKKSPVQCQGPDEHKHHWVRLGTAAEQSRAAPIVTSQVPSTAAEMPRSMEMQQPMERPIVTEMPRVREMPTVPCEERTATLGRRSNTLPPRPDPLAVRSATLLPRPIRSEPLHSPTSKRNQVQFTTFTTLDIKHLAALKRNGLDFNWASQEAGGVNHATVASQAIAANHGGSCSLVGAASQVGLCSQVKAASQAGMCSQVQPANQ